MIERNPTRIASFLAPALLVTIACTQMFLAKTRGLTPWKGGGFGMFSTVDSMDARWVRCYLIIGGHQVSVPIPDEADEERDRIRAMPSSERLASLAANIAALRWVRTERDAKPADCDGKVLKPQSPTYRVWRDEDHAPAPKDVAAVEAVRVELWRLRFDLATRRVIARRHGVATVRSRA